ncbi:protein of unknown function DUF423 [Paludibacter propionicigenes WB4]|uniref:DUF423 domain-containing protein n=1 Tax=Paludibacter propionicigenes (strain DSM 17365 / JCM 13257 / WB4) TaxID=694427 RepID=E4T0A5_PALPW|nr:DUF423 domain-containing protein [Paludibacter propionicigenes]ADQ78491.1 protein of unknown function DUF423 [Paludibacter propionicigenes WB4]
MKQIFVTAAISGMLAVALGAFGAHIIKKMITPDMLEVYKTGVQYHFYHTFALLATGILLYLQPSKSLKTAAYLFMAGIVLFSGSLYALAITGIKALGIITPFGGVAWLIAWLLLAIHFGKYTRTE